MFYGINLNKKQGDPNICQISTVFADLIDQSCSELRNNFVGLEEVISGT